MLIKDPDVDIVFAIEQDDDAIVLAALDVTAEAKSGGLCSHLLASLPLAGRIDDVEMINRQRERFTRFEVDCGNVHHLMRDLLTLEHDYRESVDRFALADSRAKSLKKDVDTCAAKVHDLLQRIATRKPLPLFEAIGG